MHREHNKVGRGEVKSTNPLHYATLLSSPSNTQLTWCETEAPRVLRQDRSKEKTIIYLSYHHHCSKLRVTAHLAPRDESEEASVTLIQVTMTRASASPK